MKTIPNQRTCTLKLTRGEVCRLLVLLAAAPPDSKSYTEIRLKIRAQLNAHDEKWKEADECER